MCSIEIFRVTGGQGNAPVKKANSLLNRTNRCTKLHKNDIHNN